ncbi:uncharacterized protein LOC136746705 [Amia ocellicauda]|uniref:uncharacterized protein LOC136746705 n=1 Tax=Amia ocellicauda TaxID=2972642 RepID=UPI0034644A1A
MTPRPGYSLSLFPAVLSGKEHPGPLPRRPPTSSCCRPCGTCPPLPEGWKQTLPAEQLQWVSRALCTRSRSGKLELTSDLCLWWFPPQPCPVYRQPPASPSLHFTRPLFLWMPQCIGHCDSHCLSMSAMLCATLCVLMLIWAPVAPGPSAPWKRDTGQSSNSDVDIYSFHIDSRVSSRYAHTVITSRVANCADQSREVLFEVELPKNAFISNFSMTVGGKTYVGEVKEKGGKTAVRQGNVPRRDRRPGQVRQRDREYLYLGTRINIITKKMRAQYLERWHTETEQQHKLQCYRSLQRDFRLALYLVRVKDPKQRQTLSQYRLSAHSL